MARNFYSKLARKFGAGMAIFGVITIIIIPPMMMYEPRDSGTHDLSVYTLLVATGGFVVSLVGTTSAILLGWRADRRQQRELASKLAARTHSNDT